MGTSGALGMTATKRKRTRRKDNAGGAIAPQLTRRGARVAKSAQKRAHNRSSRPSGAAAARGVIVGNRLAEARHVAKKTARTNTLAFKKPGRPRKSLIEWNDPSRQVQVLDWKQRAQEFGLNVDEREESDVPYEIEPARLLRSEEPEAFAAQPIPDDNDDEEQEDEDERPASAPGVSREDVDLVRVYLQHIGKRKLLKKHEEVAIGERIEQAQHELVATLAEMPCAINTLVSLADRIRSKGDPAAELILLPEGGELRDDQIAPVLRAFNRIKRRRCLLDNLRAKLENPRLGVKARAVHDAHREKARLGIIEDLATQPIRPSLIDGIVDELREVDKEFRQLENVGRTERAERCKALEGAARAEPGGVPAPLHQGRNGRRDRAGGEARADGGQPPPRRLDCQTLSESWFVIPRPDPGRQHRPDEGGGPLPVPPRLQVLDLRHLVDPPGDHKGDRRQRANDSSAGARDRVVEQAGKGAQGAAHRAWPRADAGRDRQETEDTGGEGAAAARRAEDALLAGDEDRRGRGHRARRRAARSQHPDRRKTPRSRAI